MENREKIEVYNPYSGEVAGAVPSMSIADVEKAVDKAGKYDCSLSAEERSDILLSTAHALCEQKQAYAELITSEIGISLKDSLHEVDRAIQVVIFSAEEAKKVDEEMPPAEVTPGLENCTTILRRDPVGIVCCITPFNHPLNQVVHKVCPAIAANNAVVLKPSEKSPLTALRFTSLLVENGLPEEMLQVITGDIRMIGDALIRHPAVGMISFTGSTVAGEHIEGNCGVKKLSMELGGNDVFVVTPDADVKEAARIAAIGAFANSGQRCSSIKRIVTFPENADAFAEELVKETEKLKVGDPMDTATDIGTVVDEEAATTIIDRVEDAVAKGAKLLAGGKRNKALVWPTVLDHVDPEMELVKEETFGPVAPIIRVRDFEEAVKVANGTKYGLNAAIMTDDTDLAREFAKRVDVGGVRVNQAPSFRNEFVPFGGNKMSGFGRSGIKCAIEEMTNLKTIIIRQRGDNGK